MLNVSSEFRENILRFGRQIDLIISYDDITISGKDIVSCSKKFDGKVFSSVMQYADIELEGYHDVKDKEINIKLGVSYNGCTFSYADFGNFIVDNDSIEKIEETKSTKFTVYDDLIKSHVDYDSSEIVFPCTLKDFLAYICTKCSINHIPVDFPNSNQLILDDPFENITATYRDVLDYIASASGRCIAIDDSYLVVKEYASTGVYIDQNNLSSLKIGKKWGPINSLVLAREPQEDNIYKNDEESILKNGLTEIRISNNYIIEPDRNIFIDDLFNSVKGIAFYSYEIESFGYAYFQPWDLITIVDLSGNEYVSVVMSDHLNITTGMKETIQFEFPDITTTDYSKATKKERKEKNASLYVDKKLNEIVARVNQTETDIEDNSEKIGELELTTEGFKVSISETETKVEEIEKRVTVTSISSQYGISSDKEIAPTSWLDDRPDISEGQYLWMREKYLYSNNTIKYDGVRMISAENGKDADAPLSEKTVEGNNVTITDSNDSYDIEISKMYGKSEQFTTNGYQLFDASKIPTKSQGGATVTNNGDGSFTISGSGTISEWTSQYIKYSHEKTISLIKQGTIYISNDQSNPYTRVAFRNNDNLLGILSKNSLSFKITQEMINDDTFIMILYFGCDMDTNIITGTIKPMLYQEGDGTWEPFTGGIPSPNPDYPQEIKSVENPVVNVCGKNLLNPTLTTTTIHGVTCTKKADGTYTFNGTATNICYFEVYKGKNIFKGYKLVGCPKNNITNLSLYATNAAIYNMDEGKGSVISVDTETISIYILIPNGCTCNKLAFKPMITTDLNATYDDFEPYQGQTATLPITLNAIPVSEGGNVTVDGQQYIADYVDIERKKLVRMVGEVDLGTLNWIVSGGKWASLMMPTYFEYNLKPFQALAEKYIADTPTNVYINRTLNTIANEDGNKITVYNGSTTETPTGLLKYRLATPIEIDLTDEEVRAFKLPSYYPYTNVFIDSDVQPSKTCLHYYTIFKGTYGDVGTSVENIVPEFYLSTSKTTQEGGSWSSTAPEWSNGKYLWTRNKIIYKDPESIEYTTPVCDSSWEAANETADELNKKIDKTKLSVTAEYSSAIKTVKDEIDLRVGSVETIVSEDGKKITDLETKLSVTDQLVQITKSTTETLQSAMDGKVSQEELEEYVRFDGAKVEIGKSDSLFKTVITNEELAFYQGDYKVAWISNNELHVTNAIITTAIGVGKFIFKDEGDSGFSLMMS